MKQIIICGDAGGSSTNIRAYTLDGVELLTLKGGPGSPVISFQNYYENIYNTIKEVVDSFPLYTVAYMVIGISGYDAITDIDKLTLNFNETFKTTTYLVTDLHIALADVITTNESGAIVVAGTGSAVLATSNNEFFLVGGYGQIIRERGSSYSCVHQAVLQIIDHHEEKIPFTQFEKGLMAHMHINKVSDVKYIFYQEGKDTIAKNVIYIKEQANKGVLEAKKLLYQEGQELAKQLIRAVKYLYISKPIKVGLHGGFLTKNNQDVLKGFNDKLNEEAITIYLNETPLDPLRGAYNIAMKRKKEQCM